eukprot:356138-Chlamydomonas_euryale.AAC.2
MLLGVAAAAVATGRAAAAATALPLCQAALAHAGRLRAAAGDRTVAVGDAHAHAGHAHAHAGHAHAHLHAGVPANDTCSAAQCAPIILHASAHGAAAAAARMLSLRSFASGPPRDRVRAIPFLLTQKEVRWGRPA